MALTQSEKDGLAQRIFECFKPNGEVKLKEAITALAKCHTPAEMREVMASVKDMLNKVREKQARTEEQLDAKPSLER